MQLTDELKSIFVETAQILSGSERRLFMAKVTKALGKGGQSQAESQLGWDRSTIHKGLHELEAGIRCEDNFAGRGRKPAEDHLPNLLKDIDEIVGDQSQIDKTFSTCRLYTRLTAKEVRRQLIGVTHWLPNTHYDWLPNMRIRLNLCPDWVSAPHRVL